jgi:protein SCO1/2
MHSRYFRCILVLLLVVLPVAMISPSSAWAESKSYSRSVEKYDIPAVTLIDQNGKKVVLKSLLESDKPVIIDFIFGTCTTICPVLSASYVNFQNKLGADSSRVHLVSISIDPENDTPKVMKEYLQRYRAKPGWDFLTGSRKDIDTVMRAFKAYIPNKMSHYALYLIRTPGADKWVRINGILSTSEFMAEAQKAGVK